MQEEIDQLKHEPEQLRARNRSVEADKAWETSAFRIGLISAITYIIAGFVMLAIDVDRPFVSALIPTLGYLLSTQSLPTVKRWWIQSRQK